MKKDWIFRTNIYEVNVRQYTPEGTLTAFAEHLPRLKDMGVETLWFMPLTPISQKEIKGTMGSYYACSDYTSINPEFGTLADFRKLVKQAHSMGFRVIIDWVANHTGWDHIWTRQHPDWYEMDETTSDFKRASGMDDIIELDFSNPDLRRAMIEAMKFWVKECDIDGFRCDLAFWVELHFWQDAIPELNHLKQMFWLAEADPLEFPDYMKVFDAAYTWTWMHKSEQWYQKQLPLSTLYEVLTDYLKAPGIKAWFTSNHDENSWNGTEYEKYGHAARLLAVHSCTWPGIPLVYSGQELPNLKRLKFFDKDIFDWKNNNELHEFYKTLFQLKQHNNALDARAGLYMLNTSRKACIISYMRKSAKDEVIVLLNFSDQPLRFDFLDNWVIGNFRELFTGREHNFRSKKEFEMKPWEYLVFEKIK